MPLCTQLRLVSVKLCITGVSGTGAAFCFSSSCTMLTLSKTCDLRLKKSCLARFHFSTLSLSTYRVVSYSGVILRAYLSLFRLSTSILTLRTAYIKLLVKP